MIFIRDGNGFSLTLRNATPTGLTIKSTKSRLKLLSINYMPEPSLTTPPNCIQLMSTPTPVTLPTIHLNGTGAANLEAEYRAVRQAVDEATRLLEQATCNARDFYPQEPNTTEPLGLQHFQAWQRARDERTEAFRLLQLVSNYAEQWEAHAADALRACARA